MSDESNGLIYFENGDIRDKKYRHENSAIVQILNCVGVRPHGLSMTLAEAFPYCNLYIDRSPIRNFNRAKIKDRSKPGTIRICQPKENKYKNPFIVNIFGQYYMGKSIDNNNSISQRIIRQKNVDKDLIEGIRLDTRENRINWFQQGLDQLSESFIVKNKLIDIVFPFKIGCGLGGGDWENDYLPAIEKFAEKVKENNVIVTIVKKQI